MASCSRDSHWDYALISSRVGIDGCAPRRVTEIAAATLAQRAASISVRPSASAVANAPSNAQWQHALRTCHASSASNLFKQKKDADATRFADDAEKAVREALALRDTVAKASGPLPAAFPLHVLATVLRLKGSTPEADDAEKQSWAARVKNPD